MLAERRLKRDLEGLQEDLSKLLNDFEAIAKEKGHAVAETMKDGMVTEREKVQELLQTAEKSLANLKDRAKDATENVERTIVEHPMISVAAALGIGFFVGKLLSPGKR